MMTYTDHVTIQQDSSTDDNPAADYTGAAFATDIPCRVLDVKGQETYRGNQLAAHSDYVVEMWQVEGVTPTMRLVVAGGVHDGKTLNIKHVRDMHKDSQPAQTILFCRELDS